MTVRYSRWAPAALGALAVALVLSACSSAGGARTDTSSQGASAEATSEEAAEATPGDTTSDLEALYWARQDSARASFTEADVRFMTGMIGHHAQAIVMTRLAPTHGASEAVQTLAARIANTQKDEIATMQRWLREREQHVPEIEIDGTRLLVDGTSGHGRPMEGVLTKAQIQELAATQGPAFDRLFLQYMIQHHSGAVTMVDALVSTDGAAQGEAAFKIASDINVDQKTEIARMERMLDALPAAR